MDLSGTPIRERIGHYLFPSTTNPFFTRLISPRQRCSHSLKDLFVPPLFLDILLLKNPMHLSEEHWRLIEPILPPPSPSGRGRHPLATLRGCCATVRGCGGALPVIPLCFLR
jgi:hypothetical protein